MEIILSALIALSAAFCFLLAVIIQKLGTVRDLLGEYAQIQSLHESLKEYAIHLDQREVKLQLLMGSEFPVTGHKSKKQPRKKEKSS